jgi:signal peptidase II
MPCVGRVARSSRHYTLALVLAAAVFAADQASKWVVRAQAENLPWRVFAGLRIDLNYNSGISFSRLAGAGAVVIALVSVVVAGVATALVVAPARYRPALGIILGGALGNLVDRFHYAGAVVDFIAVYRWPPFNIGDAAILVGTVILALRVLRAPRA